MDRVLLAKARNSPGFLLEASFNDASTGAPRYLLLARERAVQLQIRCSRVSIASDSSHFLQVRLLSFLSLVPGDAVRQWPARIPSNSLQSFRGRCSTQWLRLSLRSLHIILEIRKVLVFLHLLCARVSACFSKALCSVRREIGTFSVLSFVGSTPSFARTSAVLFPSMPWWLEAQ